MSDDNDIRRGRHCVFKIHVHLVFVAKYRRRVFDGDAINRLRTIFAKVCTDFDAQLIEMDGEDDHVHLLVEYLPKVAVLLCIKLWRRSHFHGAPVHRTAAGAALKTKPQDGYAVRAILPRHERRGLSRTGSIEYAQHPTR
ncbi:IS200/IS605 family transposase [Castellaniella sp.]|uniref:IS200/IS605 family transposase n=1 Tax=Castellaniella sp. TaxID=1955812 RepID=UPI00356595EC